MEFLRFNLHGNVIEFCRETSAWSWSGWIEKRDGLYFCNGSVEFKKVISKKGHGTLSVDETIICLVPGEIIADPRFASAEEAIKYHKVNNIGKWQATQYWVGYNADYREVSFYETAGGAPVELRMTAGRVDTGTVKEMKKILDVLLPLYEPEVAVSSHADIVTGAQPQLNGIDRRSAEVIWN